MTQIDFPALGLAEPLLRALAAKDFTTPTPIQAMAIPPALEGRDTLGIAQTGSGKTAAFVLPILQHLMNENVRSAPFLTRALILAPTRELALQIDETVRVLAAGFPIRTVVIIGGASRYRQTRDMRRGADIVIGTPGRVRDLMSSHELSLAATQHFVLDEADRMLDLGFMPDVRRIVDTLPQRRRSALFSATMPDAIAGLAASLLRDPVRVEIARVEATAPKIEQFVYHVPQSSKRALLEELLRDAEMSRVIVFTRTKHGANRVAEGLEDIGHRVEALHGNKSQSQRERALDLFRSGRARVLVATDIAARGIDVTGISHVVNFDLPVEPESYVHRIGRTARAGAAGVAVSFCDPGERSALRAIERLIGGPIATIGDAPVEQARGGKPAAPAAAKRRNKFRGRKPSGMRRAA